ncbi:hypothetical protein FALCPG4_008150 [Fusarium falciforme]
MGSCHNSLAGLISGLIALGQIDLPLCNHCCLYTESSYVGTGEVPSVCAGKVVEVHVGSNTLFLQKNVENSLPVFYTWKTNVDNVRKPSADSTI